MTRLLDENRRWLVLGTLFLAAGVNVGSSNYAFGLFVEPLESTFGWSRTAISASLSFVAVGSLASPIIGRLMDRHGARPVLVISLLLMGISFLVRPAMTELWHWYGLSFLQFIGISGITALPAGRLIAIWFPSSQGRIMGITVTGINFGGITIPFIVNVALGASGWQAAYVIMGLIAVALAALALLFIRELPPDAQDGSSGPSQDAGSRMSGLPLSSAMRTRSFYAIVGALALGTFAHAGVFPQLVPHFKELGVPSAWAALTVTVMAVTGLVSKPTFGYLSEHMTARRAMILTLSGQCVGAVLLVISPVLRMGGTADLRGQHGRSQRADAAARAGELRVQILRQHHGNRHDVLIDPVRSRPAHSRSDVRRDSELYPRVPGVRGALRHRGGWAYADAYTGPRGGESCRF